MPTDVIIEPSSGQIYWNDAGAIGASQSISISGNALDKIKVIGYGFIYTIGGSIGASNDRVIFNDSLTSTIQPGANGAALGDAVFSWDVYAYNSYHRQPALFQSTNNSTSLFTGSIQSNGGIGVSGNASIGQTLNIFNSTDGRYFVGFRAAAALAATTLYVLPTGYPGTGTSVLQSDTSGNLSWVAALTSGTTVGSATTAAQINVATTNTASTLYPVMSGAATTVTGTGVSSNTSLTYVPSSGVFSSPFFFSSYSVGSEGGEIVFNKPASGSGLTTTITMDIQGDKFRVFETGGANRGFYLDFSTDSVAGVGKNIIGTASIATTANNVNVSGAATSNLDHRLLFTTASTSVAGAAISSNTNLLYNPSTDLLSATGITVTSGVDSTSVTSGALVVRGGIGVTGASFFQSISVASLTGTGNVVVNGNLQFKGVGTFGDNAQLDTIALNARFSNTVAPSADNTYDLGAVGLGATGPLMWKNIYAGTAISAPTFVGLGSTSQAVSVVAATTNTSHPITFTPATTSVVGAAISTVSTVSINPSTSTITATTFSGTLSGTATTATNLNIATTNTASTVYPVFSGAATTVTGTGLSSSGSLSYVPSTGVLTATSFSGSFTGTLSGYATTGRNVDVQLATTNAIHAITFTPQLTAVVGSATSSDNTLVYNPSTKILTTSGLAVTATTIPTSSSTGALIVTGGVGIGSSLFVGGQINQTYTPATGAGSDHAVHLQSTSPVPTNVGAIVQIGAASAWDGVTAGFFSGSANGTWLGISASTANTADFINFQENGSSRFVVGLGGTTRVLSSNVSTSTSTGALVVSGGVGIGGSLYVTSATAISGVTLNNGIITGSLTGTATTSQNATVVFSSTPATNHYITFTPASGSVAGAAVSAVTSVFVVPSTGTVNATTFSGAFSGTLSGYATTGRNVDVQLASTNATHAVTFTPQLTAVVGSATSSDNMLVYNPSTKILTTSGLAVTALTETTSSTTGALLVTGSAGIARSLSIGTSVIFWNGANYSAFKSGATSNQLYTLPIGYPSTGTSVLASDTAGTLTWVPSSGAGGGSGTVNAGVASKIAYYPTSTTTVDDATGMTYTEFSSGTAVTFQIFGGAATGNTIFTVSGIGQTLVRVGIGVSNPQFELEINGEISATNKSFVIDHPTKPGKKLRYGSLEGPENGVYVRGELRDSEWIIVPDHWYGLVDIETYTVHLTPIGTYAQLFVVEVKDYNVKIADSRGLPIHCYYSVWAERKDIPKLVTEY